MSDQQKIEQINVNLIVSRDELLMLVQAVNSHWRELVNASQSETYSDVLTEAKLNSTISLWDKISVIAEEGFALFDGHDPQSLH